MESNLKEKSEGGGWELIKFAIVAFLIVVPLRLFIAQPFIVSGSSMFPTFHDKDYLIVDELSYRINSPERDDVIIFKYPKDPKKYFIKRIIGLPGETVEIKGNEIKITNKENEKGFILDEPFIDQISTDNVHITLKDGEYFVMGDNRNASSDSRYWGPVPKANIVGRALVRLWPLKAMGVLPGKFVAEK